MPEEASSLHARNTHELFLLIPIKQGFIEGPDRRISYASRLRKILELLFGPSQSVVERSLMPRASFADVIQNVLHFHYGVVERFQRSELILGATFDSSWETYFRVLVDETGDFLDAVFSHCEGFAGRSCRDGLEAFSGFIREHQVQASLLYAANPNETFDDLRILSRRDRNLLPHTPLPRPVDAADEDRKTWTKRYEALQGTIEFNRLRYQGVRQLIEGVWELRAFFPETEYIDAPSSSTARSARYAFDKVVAILASQLQPELAALLSPQAGAGVFTGDPRAPLIAAYLKQFLLPAELPTEQRKTKEEADVQERNKQRAAADPAALENLKGRVQLDLVEKLGSSEAVLALLRFPEAGAASMVRTLADWVRTQTEKGLAFNVALTHGGLRRLGLDEASLQLFPKEFRLGMEQRAGVLGDVGWPNHPEYWHQVGRGDRRVRLAAVDAVLIVHHQHQTADGKPFVEHALGLIERALPGSVMHHEYLYHRDKDYFDHATSPSNQPKLSTRGPVKREFSFDNHIALGDQFLGYPDVYDKTAQSASPTENPFSAELFRDGSFLVIRKLAQDKAEFKHQVGMGNPHALGRDKRSAETSYRDDPQGDAVHLDSHVRRVNPRRGLVPRIVRRSFSYGDKNPEEGSDYGHMFLAYNANPAQQFEVLQRWINGGNSTGLLSRQSDPVASQHTDRQRPSPVTLRWGMYLFVPSLEALTFLEQVALPRAPVDEPTARERRARSREAESARLVCRGQDIIARLDAERDVAVARLSWKQLLEEAAWNGDARAVWAAIRQSGVPKQTPIGLLCGTLEDAEYVLNDDGTRFSTREYRARLLESSLDFYLGLDKKPGPGPQGGCPHQRSYAPLAKANEALRRDFPVVGVFEDARDYALEYLEASSGKFDVRDVAREVVARVAEKWIGLPTFEPPKDKDDPDQRTPAQKRRDFLDHYVNVTRYMSFPEPEPWIRDKSVKSGRILREAYGDDSTPWKGRAAVVVAAYALPTNGTATAQQLADVRNAIIGANIGFAAPAISMIAGVLYRWLENGDLENQPPLKDRAQAQARYAALLPTLVRELRADPTFTTVYRTSTGLDPRAPAGTHVLVGLQSAYEHTDPNDHAGHPAPYEWLFGGRYGEGAHSCPFAKQSLAAIAGAIQGVVDFLDHALTNHPDRTLSRVGPTRYEIATIAQARPSSAIKPASR